MGTQETDTSDEQLYLQRDLKNFCQLSAYQSVHIRFFLSPPLQRNLESECNIYNPPLPPTKLAVNISPTVFIFISALNCIEKIEDLSTAINKHNILCPQ